MPLMLMSNPGLHLALLGNPRRKAKHGFSSRKRFTQALWKAKRRVGKTFKIKGGGSYRIGALVGVRGRRGSPKSHATGISWTGRKGGFAYRGTVKRRGHRRTRLTTFTNPLRNPMKLVSDYVGALKSAPQTVISTVKGPNKLKNIAYMGAGALGSYFLAGTVVGLMKKIPVAGKIADNPIGSRIFGAAANFTIGYVASKFVKGDAGKAILAGSIVAAVIEAAMPGGMDKLVAKLPFVGKKVTDTKAVVAQAVNGLLGIDGYVDAPSYQGVGFLPGMSVDGYVDAPSYQGVGEDALAADARDMLAGDNDMAGDNDLAGFPYLEDSNKFQASYLAP